MFMLLMPDSEPPSDNQDSLEQAKFFLLLLLFVIV